MRGARRRDSRRRSDTPTRPDPPRHVVLLAGRHRDADHHLLGIVRLVGELVVAAGIRRVRRGPPDAPIDSLSLSRLALTSHSLLLID